MATDTAASDRLAQALVWAKGHLADGVDAERLVEGLMKQGWPEYDARVVLDTALTSTAVTSVSVPPPGPARGQATTTRYQQNDKYAAAYATPNADASRHVRQMGIGALLLFVGLAITVGSYAAPSSTRGGGAYLLCWGPVIFGGIRLVTGFFGWIGSR